MKRSASAQWLGGLQDGKGALSTQSGALDNTPYNFQQRFEDQAGTNPEELIAAAHAGCFSMALSMILGEAGFTAEAIDAKAHVTLDKSEDGFAITKVFLNVSASIPDIDQAKFEELADKAKDGCPVSKLLTADISLEAKLQA